MYCEQCGSQNADQARFCRSCRSPFTNAALPPPLPGPAPGQPPPLPAPLGAAAVRPPPLPQPIRGVAEPSQPRQADPASRAAPPIAAKTASNTPPTPAAPDATRTPPAFAAAAPADDAELADPQGEDAEEPVVNFDSEAAPRLNAPRHAPQVRAQGPWIVVAAVLAAACSVLVALLLRDHNAPHQPPLADRGNVAASASAKVAGQPAPGEPKRQPMHRGVDAVRPYTVRLSAQRFAPDAYAIAHGANLRGLAELFVDGVGETDGRWYYVQSGEFATEGEAITYAQRLVRARVPAADVVDRRQFQGRSVDLPPEESFAHAALARFDALAPGIVALLRKLPYQPDIRIAGLAGFDLTDPAVAGPKLGDRLAFVLQSVGVPSAKAVSKQMVEATASGGGVLIVANLDDDARDNHFQIELANGAAGRLRCAQPALAVRSGKARAAANQLVEASAVGDICRVITAATIADMARAKSYLSEPGDEAGLLHAGELYRGLTHVIDGQRLSGLRTWGVVMERLSRKYATSRGNVSWARRMVGYWAVRTLHVVGVPPDTSTFSFESFDLGTADNARLVSTEYDKTRRQVGRVPAELRRFLGLGPTRQVEVDGVKGWYGDLGRAGANHAEVSVRLGPFMMVAACDPSQGDPHAGDALLVKWMTPFVQWTRISSADRLAGDSSADDALSPSPAIRAEATRIEALR